MKKQNKKGFTIVELVIVIAVIAILAAVLIPTFSNLIKKAQTSGDISVVRNINEGLAINEATNGKVNTMYDALVVAKEYGYDVSKITPTNEDNDIVFDTTTGRFALLDKQGNVLFADEAKESQAIVNKEVTAKYKLFKLYTKAEDAKAGEFSIYAGPGFDAAEVTNLKVGFDAGEEAITSVEYKGNGQTAQNVVIRTNGGTVTVNAPNDDVDFYGTAEILNVTDVKSTSLHLFGIAHELFLTKGHVVVEKTGLVLKVKSCGENANITNNGHISSVASDVDNTKISGKEPSTETIISKVEDLIAFANRVNGTGVEAYDFAGQIVQLSADIELTEAWTPIGDATHNFAGTFNGNGHTIKGLKTEGHTQTGSNLAFGFFGILNEGGAISNIELKDVDIITTGKTSGNCAAKYVGALVGLVNYPRQFTDISVSGKVVIGDGAKGGGIIGRYGEDDFSYDNVKEISLSGLVNNAEVAGNGAGAVAGIVGFFANPAYNAVKFTFSKCVNTGYIHTTGKSAAGIYVCNGQTNMPILGVAKTGSYTKNDGVTKSYTTYYENNCYNIGKIEAGTYACNLITNDSDDDKNPFVYVNAYGDKWYKNTVIINNEQGNIRTFIPNDEGVIGIECGVSDWFEYNGKRYEFKETSNNLVEFK